MKTHWRQLRRIGRVLWCLAAVAATVGVLPHERPWGEQAASVLVIGFIMLGIPLLIVTSFDVGAELRGNGEGPRWTRVLGYVLSVPQLALGLVAGLIGMAMIGWMLYLELTVLPWYVSLIIGFGMWPAMFLYGAHLIRTALRGSEEAPIASYEVEHDFEPEDLDGEQVERAPGTDSVRQDRVA